MREIISTHGCLNVLGLKKEDFQSLSFARLWHKKNPPLLRVREYSYIYYYYLVVNNLRKVSVS